MAGLFELDQVLVMDAIQNTGMEQAGPDSGGATGAINVLETNAFIGNKGAMLVYTPSAPGLDTPGCGYTPSWTGYLGANALGGRIGSFYLDWLKSTRTEMELAYTYILASKDLGGFIASVIA
jgi:hypothetical protein